VPAGHQDLRLWERQRAAGNRPAGLPVEAGRWEPYIGFLFHCHSEDAAVPRNAACHPKFSHLAFLL